MSSTERTIRALAGTFVTLSLLLGYFVSPYWYLFTLFVGVNLFQSAFTQWCLAEVIILKLGLIPSCFKEKDEEPSQDTMAAG